MPSLSSNASGKVLVTGASGFIGVHCCKALLERGFFVRGTVREAAKGEYLRRLFGELKLAEKFEYVLVPDINKKDAFDQAVQGVDAVQHIASPVTHIFNHPDDIIQPAINGTVGVLESVKRWGPTVKRVMYVSSVSAVTSPYPGPYVFTENDWNEKALQHVESNGDNSSGGLVYATSKVLAERSAWDYMTENRDDVKFDLTTVCPPWVWGPVLQEVASYDRLNASIQFLFTGWQVPHTNEELAERAGAFIDVRDFAGLCVDLMVTEKAGNERIILSGGEFSWQDVLDCRPLKDIPVGNPYATRGNVWDTRFSSAKAERILGKPAKELYMTLEATVNDTIKSCLERGLMPVGNGGETGMEQVGKALRF